MAGGADDRDGGRGEGWVAAQWALIGATLLAPRVGPPWSPALARCGRLLGPALLATGGALIARGIVDLGPNLTPLPKPKDDATLVRNGLYRYLRHPIYSGFIALGFGWATLTANSSRLLLAAALAAFFDAKARREEAWLLEKFPEYARYRAEVKKLLPGVY